MDGITTFLSGYKTHILVALSVLMIITTMAVGETDVGTGIQQILVALGVSALRVGVSEQFAWLAGYKTHILTVSGLLMIIGRVAAGDMDLSTALQEGVGLLGISSLRVGMAAQDKTE